MTRTINAVPARLAALGLLLLISVAQAQTPSAASRPAKGKAADTAKAAKSSPAREIFSSAFKLFQEGDFGVAKAGFERGLAIEPDNGFGRFYLAETLLRMKDYAGAWEQYNKALTLLPDTAPQRAQVDAALAEIGRNKEAAAQLNAAMAQKSLPSGITLYDWLAAAKPHATKADEAQGVLDEVAVHIRRYGPYPDLIALRDQAAGMLLRKLMVANEEQARTALPQLEALRKVAGNSTQLLLQLGKAQHFLGDFDKARQAYSAALQTMKPDAPARKNVVAALGQIEKREKPKGIQMPPEVFAAYDYIKTEWQAQQFRGEPVQPEVGQMLSSMVYMGEADEALVQFEKVRPLRKAGVYDTVHSAADSLIYALTIAGRDEQAVQLAASLPDDGGEKGSMSLSRAGYREVVHAYIKANRWDEARRYLPRLESSIAEYDKRRIDFLSAGYQFDLEKWFTVCRSLPKDEDGCVTLLSYMEREVFAPERIKRERIEEMARQLAGYGLWLYAQSDPNRVPRTLLKRAGLCSAAMALVPAPTEYSNMAYRWQYISGCYAKTGDLAAAEQTMRTYLARPDVANRKKDKVTDETRDGFVYWVVAGLLESGDIERGRSWASRVTTERYADSTRDALVSALVKQGLDAEAWKIAQSVPARDKRIGLASALISGNWQRSQPK